MQPTFHQPETFARKLAIVMAVASAVAVSAQANLTKLPHRESVPVGLESKISGASIVSVRGIHNSEALLSGPTAGVHVAGGKSEVVLKFPRQAVLGSLSFVNDGMEGEFRCFSSVDNATWIALGVNQIQADDRQVLINPGSCQGKFVKLEFNALKSGTIRCFRILGDETDADYQVTQNINGVGVPVNFADGIGGGRMIYATVGGDGYAEKMIVYDLGQPRQLTEIGSVHSRKTVQLKVFGFEMLPEVENWKGRRVLDVKSVQQGANLIAEMSDAGEGIIQMTLGKPVTARYVALNWRSDKDLSDFISYDVALIGTAVVSHDDKLDTVASLASGAVGEKNQTVAQALGGEASEVNNPKARNNEGLVDEDQSEFVTASAPRSLRQYTEARDIIAGMGFAGAGGGIGGMSFRKAAGLGSGGRAKADEGGEEAAEDEEFVGPPVYLEWSRAPSAP
ncbi:MAG TPA: hypothetical protein DIT13_01535 [Verrucomicrobiales bacterium]|nr:hypothetical protein [Verrucomicrobiales bacterium]HRJ09584.1 hypothetical protein [Prosthecobacter sp.]HRK12638.1 hypothetical protein [Prosthecobacter sp.]